MSEVCYKVHITRVLHTARISDVDSVMFRNEIREIVSFELGKEIEKDVFRLVTSVACFLSFNTNRFRGSTVRDHRGRQNAEGTSVIHTVEPCVPFFFLSNFDVICDYL